MGYALRREVRAYLSDSRSFVDDKSATSLERLIALEIASEADDITRNCQRYDKHLGRWLPTVTVELLAMWTDSTENSVSERLRCLRVRGLEFRRVLRLDKNGGPVYAYKGRATEFCVPRLAVVPSLTVAEAA
jgi:hypothetical protein